LRRPIYFGTGRRQGTSRCSYHASDGAAYQRFLGRWTAVLAPLFADFAGLPEEGAVLDVGCGTGSLALSLAAARRPVVALDIALPYLAFARTQPGGAGIGFVRADACHLPFATGAFAGALSQLALNFTADPARAVGEMRRVVRSGGVVAGAVWDFRGGLVYQRLFWDTAAVLDPAAAQVRDRLFSHPLALPDGLLALWRQAGLARLERGSLTMRMDYADFADYWEPLGFGQGPVGSYVERLPPARRAAIEAAVRAAYLSGAPDGPRSLTATAWAVRGVVP
jgi:SAM-dependent methyltransferase